MKNKFPQKTHCYKDDCKPVRTGFHLEDYPSCKVCKMELTEELYKKLTKRNKDDEELKKAIDKWFV
jgi:hypothetical protein